ncbi:MAG TPA: hypothetical protein DE179_14790 [Oceanospirillaceae bacterium]|nr:hypothetical protein [Oceanospirillaceae bacterium]
MNDPRVTAIMITMLVIASWLILYIEYGAAIAMDMSSLSLLLLSVGIYTLLWLSWRQQRAWQQREAGWQDKLAELESLAFEDEQTSLPNYSAFLQQVSTALEAPIGSGVQGVVAIQIDRFDYVHEVVGHDGLQELLQQISHRLQQVGAHTDVLARGAQNDSFLIWHYCHTDADLELLANKILDIMEEPFAFQSSSMMLYVSIGVCRRNDESNTAKLLCENAITAQQMAHVRGGGQWNLYHPLMGHENTDRFYMHNALYHALANNELYVVYQPQVDALNNTLAGFEALLRWRNPSMGEISPAEFIPLAEEIGLISDIGRWTIGQVCMQQVQWQQQGNAIVPVAINVSPIQITQGDLVDDLEDQLARWNLEAKYLEIEVTESCLINGLDEAVSTLQEVRDIGIEIAIDDFGTGYSSLNYLKRLPGNKVKIDRAFVQEMHEDADDQAIIQAVISMSSQLGMHVLAEGVETEQQKELLMHLGCNLMQGYLYSKPLLPADCETWLTGQVFFQD